MNFQVMPELNWVWEVGGYTIPLGYIFAILLMVLFSGCTMLYFRYKKWL
jgi:Mg2+ and Co2+ transporter CorA